MQQAETPLKMSNRFEVSESRCGMPPRLQPLLDRAFGVAGDRQVMGKQFRLALGFRKGLERHYPDVR